MMSVQSDGIYITREADDDGLVLAYSFEPDHYTREMLEGLAWRILGHNLVDDEFLIKNGFKREWGARGVRSPK